MRRLAGGHEPKCNNRSSKHLNLLIGQKPVVRSFSNEFLQKLANNGDQVAKREITRRSNLKKNRKAE